MPMLAFDLGVRATWRSRQSCYGTDALDHLGPGREAPALTPTMDRAILRAAVKVGVELESSWNNVSGGFEYAGQWPSEDEMEIPGRHYLWYTAPKYLRGIHTTQMPMTCPLKRHPDDPGAGKLRMRHQPPNCTGGG